MKLKGATEDISAWNPNKKDLTIKVKEGRDLLEDYKENGFGQVKKQGNADFYEIWVYKNKSKGTSIVEIWDYFNEIARFVCYGERETFECYREMLKLGMQCVEFDNQIKEWEDA